MAEWKLFPPPDVPTMPLCGGLSQTAKQVLFLSGSLLTRRGHRLCREGGEKTRFEGKESPSPLKLLVILWKTKSSESPRERGTLSSLTGWAYRALSSAPGHPLSLRAESTWGQRGGLLGAHFISPSRPFPQKDLGEICRDCSYMLRNTAKPRSSLGGREH